MKMRSALWMSVMLVLSSSAAVRASSIAKETCPETCGNVRVPYPFGFGNPECAKNSSFLLNCTQNGSLFFENIQIYNISLEDGTFTGNISSAFECYNHSGLSEKFDQEIDLTIWPFTISPTHNKLTALGCDTLALMGDSEGRFGSGCIGLCKDPKDIEKDGSCSGYGCCQTSIPKNVQTLNITVTGVSNHSDSLDFSPCSYAFVVADSYNISKIDFRAYPTQIPSPHVVLEWVVGGQEYCQESKACGKNAVCAYADTGGGSRCHCLTGFAGNPYLQQGCQNIDECKEPKKYPCQGKCRNTFGNYTCQCPLGMRGDGKFGCRGLRLTTIATGSDWSGHSCYN